MEDDWKLIYLHRSGIGTETGPVGIPTEKSASPIHELSHYRMSRWLGFVDRQSEN